MAVRLFVGNLPYDVTEAELREHFAAIGPVSFIALPTDRDTGKPRGFAFVEFSARADAEEAMRRLNNQVFRGRPLAVNEARARDDHTPSSAPRPAPPRPAPSRPAPARPAFTPEPSVGESRDIVPNVPQRRRRTLAKGAPKTEQRPKRPAYKRPTGPVRFSMDDDDEDLEEAPGTSRTSRPVDEDEYDTE